MLMNRRIHLSTSDTNNGVVSNHGNVDFNLSRGNFKVETPRELSLGLIKAMIPGNVSFMGTSETHPVFCLIIGQTEVPPFTAGEYFFYFTDTKYEFPYGVGNLDSVYIPISHIDSVETFIGIVNQLLDVVTGGNPTNLFAIDNIDNTLVATSSANTLLIPMSLYNPKLTPTIPLKAYRPQNETIMRMLGININTTEPSTRLGAITINRDIKYPVGMYLPPLLLKTNLSLNSVSSNSRISGKILASINCEVAVSSESYNLIFTPQV